MRNKLISIWISLIFMLCSVLPVFADGTGNAQFLNRMIYVDEVSFYNHYLEHPIVLYKNVTYFPLDEEVSQIFGLQAEMDWENRCLLIQKTEKMKSKPASATLKSNLKNVPVSEVPDVTAIVKAGEQESTVRFSQYPLLRSGTVLYLPARALIGESCFGWSIYYDDYSGIYFSTTSDKTAYSMFDRKESSTNRSLAQYMRSRNGALSSGDAVQLTFLFKHEADVVKEDRTLLMAIAEKESSFRRDAVGGNSIGLMQINASTAAGYGYSAADLRDPHKNIELGARILHENRAKFGSTEKALAAYNQGAGAVSRGQMRTAYYTRVLDAQMSVNSCVK